VLRATELPDQEAEDPAVAYMPVADVPARQTLLRPASKLRTLGQLFWKRLSVGTRSTANLPKRASSSVTGYELPYGALTEPIDIHIRTLTSNEVTFKRVI